MANFSEVAYRVYILSFWCGDSRIMENICSFLIKLSKMTVK